MVNDVETIEGAWEALPVNWKCRGGFLKWPYIVACGVEFFVTTDNECEGLGIIGKVNNTTALIGIAPWAHAKDHHFALEEICD